MAEKHAEIPAVPVSREGLDLDFIESMGEVIVNLEMRAEEILVAAIEQGKSFLNDEYDRITSMHLDAHRVLSLYKAEVAIHITSTDRETTIPIKIDQWLRLTENAYCDECISSEFGLTQSREAQRVTTALAATDDFLRFRGFCHSCGREKLVTQNV